MGVKNMPTNNALDTIELLTKLTTTQVVNDKEYRQKHRFIRPHCSRRQIKSLIRKFAGTGIYGTIDESEVEAIATNILEKICFDSPCIINHGRKEILQNDKRK